MLSNPLSVKAYRHTEFIFENENAPLASTKFICCITNEDEEHKMGKSLLKTAATYLTALVVVEEDDRKIQLQPLSDNMDQKQLKLVHRMYWKN
jgi:hypothetical protein